MDLLTGPHSQVFPDAARGERAPVLADVLTELSLLFIAVVVAEMEGSERPCSIVRAMRAEFAGLGGGAGMGSERGGVTKRFWRDMSRLNHISRFMVRFIRFPSRSNEQRRT